MLFFGCCFFVVEFEEIVSVFFGGDGTHFFKERPS